MNISEEAQAAADLINELASREESLLSDTRLAWVIQSAIDAATARLTQEALMPPCLHECRDPREDKATVCSARHLGWECTRLAGHIGDHVACGEISGHALAVWPQEQGTRE